MAEGPIPWTAINDWALRYGINGEDFERLVTIIKKMDVAYIEYRSKKHKKNMDDAMKSSNPGSSKAPMRVAKTPAGYQKMVRK